MFFFRYALPDKAGALIEELKTVAESASIFTRDQQDIWQDSAFSDQLRKSGRKTLILAALMTDLFLVSPSLLAVSRGYRTYAVMDATSWSQEALTLSTLRLLQAGVTPISIASVITELRFRRGGPASEQLEYIFGVYDAMFGMTGNISAAMHATLPSALRQR
jgi:isochorismate hydrolase